MILLCIASVRFHGDKHSCGYSSSECLVHALARSGVDSSSFTVLVCKLSQKIVHALMVLLMLTTRSDV